MRTYLFYLLGRKVSTETNEVRILVQNEEKIKDIFSTTKNLRCVSK